MSLLLGIDLGTSYFKVGLFDEAGRLRGLGRVAVAKATPQPGYSELAVGDFWRLLRSALGEALRQAGAEAHQIAGLSYSAQANSFLLLDRGDEPLTPLIIWTDQRADPLDAGLADFSATPAFGARTGFIGWSSRSAVAKWHWVREHQPGVWKRMGRILTLSDYLVFALTGQARGDAGTAALLGLWDLPAQAWWPEALQRVGLEENNLAVVAGPGQSAGRTGPAAAGLSGLPAGIPLALGSLDHHVAALGAGVGTVAEVGISTGTVLAALTLTDRIRPQARCYHGQHFDGRGYYRLMFDPQGAGQLEDYQRTFAPGCTLEQLLAAAETVPAGTRPSGQPVSHPDPGKHAGFVRRLLEQIAFTQRTLVRQLAGDAPVRQVVAGGGGARSPFWLQIMADMLRVPVVTPHSPESACLGAAMLAAVAAGWHRTPGQAAQAMMLPGKRYEPDAQTMAVYRHGSVASP